jgi:putative ABC transport system ATP-binding protein
LLICDEPTSALDAETGWSVMEMLRDKAVHPQRVVIVVTHDSRIFGFSDRTARMEDGRIVGVDESPAGGELHTPVHAADSPQSAV